MTIDVTTPAAAAVGEVTVDLQRTGAVHWLGVCQCAHGQVRERIFSAGPSDLDPASMVRSLRANHDRTIHCHCPYAPPATPASVTFNVASTITTGQLRLIPQASATMPAGNFSFGPPITCLRFGAYQLDLVLTLNKNPQAVHGFASIMLDRTIIARTSSQAPTIGLLPSPEPEAVTTTVSVSTMANIAPGQFVLAAYENVAGPPVDVTLATFTLGGVWVPPP